MEISHNKPLSGSVRVVEKFLFLPKKLGHERKWFTKVKIRQKYAPRYSFGGIVFRWKDMCFLEP